MSEHAWTMTGEVGRIRAFSCLLCGAVREDFERSGKRLRRLYRAYGSSTQQDNAPPCVTAPSLPAEGEPVESYEGAPWCVSVPTP